MASEKKQVLAKAALTSPKTSRTTPPKSPAVAMESKRPPERPRRSGSGRRKPGSRLMRRLSSFLTILMLAISVGAGAVFLVNATFEAPGPLEVAKGFVVPKGASRLEIAERLERDGVISSHWVFTTGQLIQQALGLRKPGDLKAGSYEFKKFASMRDVVDILVEGKSVATKITIPEGLTSQQIVERLKANESLTGEIEAVPPEGSLMPDTYAFTRGTSRQELLDRMSAEQTKFVSAAWEKRQAGVPFASVQQAVIMASIVEKETGRGDERDKVAAVFVNRLRKNMRLQSDPTIIYGIVGGQGSLGRPITRADIDQKSAYNTYHIDGLPPTPIANPGRLAIEATLNPAQTADIYFVADGTGGHTFTSNLKDHNAAVANWRRLEKEAKLARAQAVVPTPATTLVKLNGQGAKAAASASATTEPDPVMTTELGDGPAPDTATSVAVAPATIVDIPLPTRKPKR